MNIFITQPLHPEHNCDGTGKILSPNSQTDNSNISQYFPRPHSHCNTLKPSHPPNANTPTYQHKQLTTDIRVVSAGESTKPRKGFPLTAHNIYSIKTRICLDVVRIVGETLSHFRCLRLIVVSL